MAATSASGGTANMAGLAFLPCVQVTTGVEPARQRPSRITRRDRSLQLLQFGFEKGVGDDQRLDGLTRITVTSRDGLMRSASLRASLARSADARIELP
jgi:hypothetical protein